MSHPAYTLLNDLRTKFKDYLTPRMVAYLGCLRPSVADVQRLNSLTTAALRTHPDLVHLDRFAAEGWEAAGLAQLESEYRSAHFWGYLTKEEAEQKMMEARLLGCPVKLLAACAAAWAARDKASRDETRAKVMRGGFPVDPNELHHELPEQAA
ncbi:hypothetical protein LJ737_20925 [Hymenobacter sp. 15J16-1T3B]|uniref:hypothetical protein n=1 Tax=Hymenobacter sp. 15J16-1T3B TaxID=2886941 RepID=UPI001D11BE23|nr:hypothetical protein [Hymenobacter sp. 15J16-1T3B]MCC3159718.1 hypothetical protein [Hymenobacter sp. 15J16-1T3B]